MKITTQEDFNALSDDAIEKVDSAPEVKPIEEIQTALDKWIKQCPLDLLVASGGFIGHTYRGALHIGPADEYGRQRWIGVRISYQSREGLSDPDYKELNPACAAPELLSVINNNPDAFICKHCKKVHGRDVARKFNLLRPF